MAEADVNKEPSLEAEADVDEDVEPYLEVASVKADRRKIGGC